MAQTQERSVTAVDTCSFPSTATHFSPHVTIGLGTKEFLDAMLAEPFASFTFSPAGASVYHLGNYGTAMKKLHAVPVKHYSQRAVSGGLFEC